MQSDNSVTECQAGQDWPQGFDIRAEHAEQQELLAAPFSSGSDSDD